jgi:hypothetical protein
MQKIEIMPRLLWSGIVRNSVLGSKTASGGAADTLIIAVAQHFHQWGQALRWGIHGPRPLVATNLTGLLHLRLRVSSVNPIRIQANDCGSMAEAATPVQSNQLPGTPGRTHEVPPFLELHKGLGTISLAIVLIPFKTTRRSLRYRIKPGEHLRSAVAPNAQARGLS